jgi:hypothetical protein
MTKRTLTDEHRIAMIREALDAARGDWHEVTNLWSVCADLDWLLERATFVREAAASPEPVDGLPERVVVGANGAYWRDFWTHYSMCPVSEDNEPVEPMAIYVRVDDLRPAIDRRGRRAECMGSGRAATTRHAPPLVEDRAPSHRRPSLRRSV